MDLKTKTRLIITDSSTVNNSITVDFITITISITITNVRVIITNTIITQMISYKYNSSSIATANYFCCQTNFWINYWSFGRIFEISNLDQLHHGPITNFVVNKHTAITEISTTTKNFKITDNSIIKHNFIIKDYFKTNDLMNARNYY